MQNTNPSRESLVEKYGERTVTYWESVLVITADGHHITMLDSLIESNFFGTQV